MAPLAARGVTIATVPIGNAGNLSESSDLFGTPVGGVAYAYHIGTYEVTNAQYAEFLNAKAATDPLGLYNPSMDSAIGGITRSGSDGSYAYATIAGWENRPVNLVSWYDALRFTNWLHNGQGNGDTESGAYLLSGGTATPTSAQQIVRSPDAAWFVASEDEWYKAAYHQNDGVTGNYFDYATGSDTAPVAELPPGGDNSANFDQAIGSSTDVGAYDSSASPYGTFDQGGNVWEWTDTAFASQSLVPVIRGGSWFSAAGLIRSRFRIGIEATEENSDVGFRVATIPEPAAVVLGAMALAALAAVGLRKPRARFSGTCRSVQSKKFQGEP